MIGTAGCSSRTRCTLHPVEARKPDVEHEQVVIAVDSGGARLAACRERVDLVALALQRTRKGNPDPVIVLRGAGS